MEFNDNNVEGNRHIGAQHMPKFCNTSCKPLNRFFERGQYSISQLNQPINLNKSKF